MGIENLKRMGSRKANMGHQDTLSEYLDEEVTDIISRRQNTQVSLENSGQINWEALKKQINRREGVSYAQEKSLGAYDMEQKYAEQYLPFAKEEIRPSINPQNTNVENDVRGSILSALGPIIEEWLEENLERIVYEVVEKKISRSSISRSQGRAPSSRLDDRRSKRVYDRR